MEFPVSTCHYRSVTGTLSTAAMSEKPPVELRQVAADTRRVTLGDDIRQARERAQLTQPELAERVGVSEGTISNWERGVVKTPKNRLARVWEVLRDYREPRPTRDTPSAGDGFDPNEVVSKLTSEQLAALAATLPDHVVADDIARRLRRNSMPRPSVPSRTWAEADIPPNPAAGGDRTGEQPA
jgi:DNA-binding transcriptional regulator YiaG